MTKKPDILVSKFSHNIYYMIIIAMKMTQLSQVKLIKKLMSSDSDRVDVDEGDSSDTELERPAKSIQYLK